MLELILELEKTRGSSTISISSSNTTSNSITQDQNDNNTFTISYSNIEGGKITVSGTNTLNWLDGNIDVDPLFELIRENHSE